MSVIRKAFKAEWDARREREAAVARCACLMGRLWARVWMRVHVHPASRFFVCVCVCVRVHACRFANVFVARAVVAVPRCPVCFVVLLQCRARACGGGACAAEGNEGQASYAEHRAA